MPAQIELAQPPEGLSLDLGVDDDTIPPREQPTNHAAAH
jgi:hypothetical protein